MSEPTDTDPGATARTTLSRMREKGSRDRTGLDHLLDTALIGHVGFVDDDGRPVVIPTAIARDGDHLLLHGSTGSGWMRRLATGVDCSVAVTEFDALVVARSAFESSINYRSAVLFGVCTALAGDDHRRALDRFTEALLPGRTAEVREPRPVELAKTMVLALPIAEWSLKVSDSFGDDGPDDIAGPAWGGIVPRVVSYGAPVPAPDLRPGIEVPASVRRLTAPGS